MLTEEAQAPAEREGQRLSLEEAIALALQERGEGDESVRRPSRQYGGNRRSGLVEGSASGDAHEVGQDAGSARSAGGAGAGGHPRRADGAGHAGEAVEERQEKRERRRYRDIRESLRRRASETWRCWWVRA